MDEKSGEGRDKVDRTPLRNRHKPVGEGAERIRESGSGASADATGFASPGKGRRQVVTSALSGRVALRVTDHFLLTLHISVRRRRMGRNASPKAS